MTDFAIKVQGLSKQYKIGVVHEQHDTLRDQLTASAARLFRRGHASARAAERIVWALKDVTFEVPVGERIGIVGPNGAGKSTLLKILSRVVAPTEGRAEVLGRVGALLEVGTGFHPELTGRENVFLNGVILGMSRRDVQRRFDEIVEFSETGRYIDTPIKRYSSGMQVRLAFAVAAHLDPDVLVVDEVLAVGDHAFRQKCLGKMGEAQGEGRTVIFVSHDMHNIRRLCNTAVWLDHGGVREIGSAREVTFSYEAAHTSSERVQGAVFVRGAPPIGAQSWINRLELLDDGGEHRSEFEFGEPMTLRFGISHPETILYDNMYVTWVILDEDDTRISTGSTLHWDIPVTNRASVAECRIAHLPLYKGHYKLEVGIQHEMAGEGWLDHWQDAGQFGIVYSAPTGTAYEIDRRSGYVHLEQRWTVGDAAATAPQAVDG